MVPISVLALRILFSCALLLGLVGERSVAQQRLTIPDVKSCGGCSIERVRVSRIGSPQDSLYYNIDGTAIARDARGRIYIGPREPRGQMTVTVYDSTGKYLTAIARSDDGPGEILSLHSLLLSPGDSLLLLDRTKVVVYSPS